MKKKIIFAVPKGRILEDLIPMIQSVGIRPEKEFFEDNSRKLIFKTNLENFEIIRVRSFDVATFIALGAAHIGVAGDDVLNEFNYDEICSVLDLNIGKCRLVLAKKKHQKIFEENNLGNIKVATKYKNTVTNFFANKGVRAECIKLNGAVEIASNLGICSYIVDLVSTGRTLSENELVEQETLFNITSKLIVNKIALKVMNPDLEKFIRKFQERING